MSTMVVTGGAGFIGSHLVDQLLEKGHKVTVIDNLSTGKKEYINKKASFKKGDICDFSFVRKVTKKADYIYHLAALPRIQRSVHDPLHTNEVNVQGTLNVLEAARQNHIKQVIFTSSSSVYGKQSHAPFTEEMIPHPLSPYALQKMIGEQYCKLYFDLYGLKTVVLRLFSVYGPRQTGDEEISTVIGRFLYLAKHNKPLVIFGDGNQQRDFTHVEDVIRALISIPELSLPPYEIINVCAGIPHSIHEVSQLIGGKSVYKEQRQGESDIIHGSNKKALKLLHWKPYIKLGKGILTLTL